MSSIYILLFTMLISSTMAIWPFPDINKPYLPWKLGHCKSLENRLYNFTPEKFFTGKWYEKSSFGNYLIQGDSICTSMESKIDGNRVTTLFYQYEPLLDKYAYLRGETDLQNLNGANFVVKFDFLAGLADLKVPITVVDTDYTNYAILYSCQEALGFKAEMAWTVTRQRRDDSQDEKIKSSLSAAGLKADDFITQQAVGCGPHEPHL